MDVEYILPKVFLIICVLIIGCDNKCPTCLRNEKVFISLSSSHSTSESNFEVIHIVVTDNGGHPRSSIRVDWEIIQGEGTLSETSSLTDDSGKAYSGVYWSQPGIIKIKAIVEGNVTDDIITIEVGEESE